jgi:hypothetical protein
MREDDDLTYEWPRTPHGKELKRRFLRSLERPAEISVELERPAEISVELDRPSFFGSF